MSDAFALALGGERTKAQDLNSLSRRARLVLGGFVLIVFGSFAVLPITGAVLASGIVVASEEARPLQSADGGDIKEILVREGDKVAAGQVLMRLDSTMATADFGIVDAQRFAAAIRVSRLESERDGHPFPNEGTLPAASDEQRRALADETALVRAHIERRSAEIGRLSEQRTQISSALTGLESQIENRNSEIILLAGEIAELEELSKKGLVPKSRLNALKRAASQLAGENARALAEVATSQSRLAELDAQERQLAETTKGDTLSELRDAEAQLLSLNEKWTAVSERLAQRTIRAPFDGVVHELAPGGPGSVAQAGKSLMTIVPLNGDWLVEARVPPQQIEHIRVGSPCVARLLSADPQASMRVSCEVIFIGAAAEADARTGAGYVKLRAKVTDGGALASEGRLMTGLPTELYVETGSRSLLSYLLEPLTRQIERSLRES